MSIACLSTHVTSCLRRSPLIHIRKSVRSGSMFVAPTIRVARICPKCGNTIKSGEFSCCAPGGTWFKKCGDAADRNFDHTWAEGIQACTRKLQGIWRISVMRELHSKHHRSRRTTCWIIDVGALCVIFTTMCIPIEETTMTSRLLVSSSRCPKCSIAEESGKPSCCARGGSWFKQCGDAGDTKFYHTWAEGIQACKSKF